MTSKQTVSLSELLKAADERDELRTEVERLRGYHEADKYTLTIQARENERLRAQVAAFEVDWQKRHLGVIEDNERLRAALEKIANTVPEVRS